MTDPEIARPQEQLKAVTQELAEECEKLGDIISDEQNRAAKAEIRAEAAEARAARLKADNERLETVLALNETQRRAAAVESDRWKLEAHAQMKRAGKAEARASMLDEWLAGRDKFIVEQGLWSAFCASLPSALSEDSAREAPSNTKMKVPARTVSPLLRTFFSFLDADHKSYAALAKVVGISPVTLSRWKAGIATPTLTLFEYVAEAAGYQLTLTKKE